MIWQVIRNLRRHTAVIIVTIYSQQDATFLEFIYFYTGSTGFRRFLCPSSWAHNCTYSFRYLQPILLLAAVLVVDTWSCIYSYELSMMGGGTAWNM